MNFQGASTLLPSINFVSLSEFIHVTFLIYSKFRGTKRRKKMPSKEEWWAEHIERNKLSAFKTIVVPAWSKHASLRKQQIFKKKPPFLLLPGVNFSAPTFFSLVLVFAFLEKKKRWISKRKRESPFHGFTSYSSSMFSSSLLGFNFLKPLPKTRPRDMWSCYRIIILPPPSYFLSPGTFILLGNLNLSANFHLFRLMFSGILCCFFTCNLFQWLTRVHF